MHSCPISSTEPFLFFLVLCVLSDDNFPVKDAALPYDQQASDNIIFRLCYLSEVGGIIKSLIMLWVILHHITRLLF